MNGWTIECSLDDVSYLAAYGGKRDSLCRRTSDGEEIEYYASFRPDSSYWYYGLAMQAHRYVPRVGQRPEYQVPRLEFEQLVVRSESGLYELSFEKSLLQRWPYGPQYWSGVQPIPINPKSKSGFIDVKILLINDTTAVVIDSISLSLQYERHRLVRTILNPWP